MGASGGRGGGISCTRFQQREAQGTLDLLVTSLSCLHVSGRPRDGKKESEEEWKEKKRERGEARGNRGNSTCQCNWHLMCRPMVMH